MQLIEKNREPTAFDLRAFGAVVAVFFAIVGWIVGRASMTAAGTIWGIAAAMIVIYYAVPQVRRMAYFAWMTVFYPVGWIISHALLAAVYYLVMTPTGLLMRLFGRDPMRRQFERDAQTYWIPHDAQQEASRYFRQF